MNAESENTRDGSTTYETLPIETLPIELDVRDRDAIVVGADATVCSKIGRLLAAGARVAVYPLGGDVALPPALAARVVVAEGAPDDAALGAALVVFASPSQTAWAKAFAPRARAERSLFSAIDRPELSTFINPAALSVSGISLRFASGGALPGFVRRLRIAFAEALAEPSVAAFVARVAALRHATPRDERAAVVRAALAGLSVKLELRLPTWFTEDRDPPSA
jgi:siroheme synthase-like protein